MIKGTEKDALLFWTVKRFVRKARNESNWKKHSCYENVLFAMVRLGYADEADIVSAYYGDDSLFPWWMQDPPTYNGEDR